MKTFPEQSILVDSPKEVDVVAIEEELMQLWSHASEVPADGQAAPVIRACSLNLIVITEDDSQVPPLGDLVGAVTVEHPSRIFLVVADRRSAGPSFEAWVSSRCFLPAPGEKQVCCEQINLIARGTEGNKIPSLVTSLLVSDVPTVLLWMARVSRDDALLRSLVGICDHALMNSSTERFPQQAFAAWQELLQGQSGHAAFGDLAWTQLTGWRTIVAQVFHPIEMRSNLLTLDTVTIEYSSATAPTHSGLSQSLLLAGWLAHRLRWTVIYRLQRAASGEYGAKFRLAEQAVTIRIIPVPVRTDRPDGIESITFHTSSGTIVAFQATGSKNFVRVVQEGGGVARDEMLISLKDESEAELVAGELEVLHRDRPYEETLAALNSLFME